MINHPACRLTEREIIQNNKAYVIRDALIDFEEKKKARKWVNIHKVRFFDWNNIIIIN